MKVAQLKCENCESTARNTSKERNRFLRRHPAKCKDRARDAEFTRRLAQGYRLADEPKELDGSSL